MLTTSPRAGEVVSDSRSEVLQAVKRMDLEKLKSLIGAGKLKSSRNAKAADSKIFLPIVSSRASTKASASEGTRSHELDVVPELSER